MKLNEPSFAWKECRTQKFIEQKLGPLQQAMVFDGECVGVSNALGQSVFAESPKRETLRGQKMSSHRISGTAERRVKYRDRTFETLRADFTKVSTLPDEPLYPASGGTYRGHAVGLMKHVRCFPVVKILQRGAYLIVANYQLTDRQTNIMRGIWKALDGNFTFFLICIMFGGIYLYFDRPSVGDKDDMIEINGTLRNISQVLVYSKKIKRDERDSTYHIYLNEYPSKFQVSYSSYDRRTFYRTSKTGDKIKLHIAKEDEKNLRQYDNKIRSFSLTVNSKEYLPLDKGLSGFGKGIFELLMIFIPLTVITFIVIKNLKEQ